MFAFPLDHIVAKQHGEPTEERNLALCCVHCNLHKGPNIGGRDPDSGTLQPLFNPRTDRWSHHFRWDGPAVVGLTPVGRTTIAVLAMNSPGQPSRRMALLQAGLFRLA